MEVDMTQKMWPLSQHLMSDVRARCSCTGIKVENMSEEEKEQQKRLKLLINKLCSKMIKK